MITRVGVSVNDYIIRESSKEHVVDSLVKLVEMLHASLQKLLLISTFFK